MLRARGMTLVDVVIGTALFLIIFLALVSLLRDSLQVSSLAKSKAMATSVAESQMEYIRSLPYNSVGTVGGIPAGPVPQNASSTQNGINFSIRTFIEYVDDPADGTGSGDTNGIMTDYKRIKVAVYFATPNGAREMDLVSNYAPHGIETTNGGGTLKVSVVNATGTGVPGASVHIVNSAISPSVDLTTFTDSSGTVFLPGAATSTQYQVSVTKSGYSSAQTYLRDSTNQNPTPGYLTIVKNQTTTGTFAIDLMSSLTLKSFSPVATSTVVETFTTSNGIQSQSNTQVSGGNVQLLNGGSGYSLSGTVVSTTTSPVYLVSWGAASSTVSLPAGTSVRLHVLDGSGVKLPDSVLPGNNVGFTSYPINLFSVSTSTYPVLALSGDLATSATTTTPLLHDWSLSYRQGPVPLPNVAFTVTGGKTIGSTGAGAPLYKTTVSGTTNSSGTFTQAIEWDSYSFVASGYDVVDTCSLPPFAISPGANSILSLIFGAQTTNALLVGVADNAGLDVSGASVTLSRSGFTKTVTTSSCGTAYFGNITSASDYTVSASKTGYATVSASGVSGSGHPFYGLAFN